MNKVMKSVALSLVISLSSGSVFTQETQAKREFKPFEYNKKKNVVKVYPKQNQVLVGALSSFLGAGALGMAGYSPALYKREVNDAAGEPYLVVGGALFIALVFGVASAYLGRDAYLKHTNRFTPLITLDNKGFTVRNTSYRWKELDEVYQIVTKRDFVTIKDTELRLKSGDKVFIQQNEPALSSDELIELIFKVKEEAEKISQKLSSKRRKSESEESNEKPEEKKRRRRRRN